MKLKKIGEQVSPVSPLRSATAFGYFCFLMENIQNIFLAYSLLGCKKSCGDTIFVFNQNKILEFLNTCIL